MTAPCAGRFVLVLGEGAPLDRTVDALERDGYGVARFASAAEALPWLDEETPCAAILAGRVDPALREELAARGVPLLAAGADPAAVLAA